MRNWWGRLLADEAGTAGPEWAFVVSVLVLVAVSGIVASRSTVLHPTDPPRAETRQADGR